MHVALRLDLALEGQRTDSGFLYKLDLLNEIQKINDDPVLTEERCSFLESLRDRMRYRIQDECESFDEFIRILVVSLESSDSGNVMIRVIQLLAKTFLIYDHFHIVLTDDVLRNGIARVLGDFELCMEAMKMIGVALCHRKHGSACADYFGVFFPRILEIAMSIEIPMKQVEKIEIEGCPDLELDDIDVIDTSLSLQDANPALIVIYWFIHWKKLPEDIDLELLFRQLFEYTERHNQILCILQVCISVITLFLREADETIYVLFSQHPFVLPAAKLLGSGVCESEIVALEFTQLIFENGIHQYVFGENGEGLYFDLIQKKLKSNSSAQRKQMWQLMSYIVAAYPHFLEGMYSSELMISALDQLTERTNRQTTSGEITAIVDFFYNAIPAYPAGQMFDFGVRELIREFADIIRQEPEMEIVRKMVATLHSVHGHLVQMSSDEADLVADYFLPQWDEIDCMELLEDIADNDEYSEIMSEIQILLDDVQASRSD